MSVDEILSLVTEEEIFEKYLFGYRNTVQLGKKYINPLRPDKKASCYFNQGYKRLFFNDPAYSELSGDCFKMIMLRQSCSLREALDIVEKDFLLGEEQSVSPYIFAGLVEKKEKKVSDIRVKIMPFNESDLEYWKSFSIEKRELKKFKVHSVLKVWIENRFYHTYSLKDPCYCYLVNDRLKIYRPLSKKYKWRSNCSIRDIQGYEQLVPKGNQLIITKSLKDIMVLDRLGFNSIALQGEGMKIPEDIAKDLKERFKKIVVFYDNDEAGVTGSLNLTKTLKCDYFNIPKGLPKDPSDFVKEYSTLKLLELMKNKNIRARW